MFRPLRDIPPRVIAKFRLAWERQNHPWDGPRRVPLFFPLAICFGLRLLLLLGLWLMGGRGRWRLVHHVRLAVAVGLFRQKQIGLGQPFKFGFLERIGFGSCERGQVSSLDTVLVGRGHWRPM